LACPGGGLATAIEANKPPTNKAARSDLSFMRIPSSRSVGAIGSYLHELDAESRPLPARRPKRSTKRGSRAVARLLETSEDGGVT
jgi:hypothetical protein